MKGTLTGEMKARGFIADRGTCEVLTEHPRVLASSRTLHLCCVLQFQEEGIKSPVLRAQDGGSLGGKATTSTSHSKEAAEPGQNPLQSINC